MAATIMRVTLRRERYLAAQRYFPFLSNDLMSSWSPRNETNRSVCRSWKMKRNARLPRHSNSLSPNFRMPRPLWVCGWPKLSPSSQSANKHSTFSARGSFRNRRSTSGSIVRVLARIIHEGFYCNCGYAVPTGVLATQSVNILVQVCLPPSWLCLPVSLRVCAVSSRTLVNNAGLAKHLPQLLGRDANQFFRPLESLVTSIRGLLQSDDLLRCRSVFALRVIGGFYFDPSQCDDVRPADDPDVLTAGSSRQPATEILSGSRDSQSLHIVNIQSVYSSVKRRCIWSELEHNAMPPVL